MVYIDEEVNIQHSSETKEDYDFDRVVAGLEELLLGSQFQEMQNSFCDAHCGQFLCDVDIMRTLGLLVYVFLTL